VSKYPCALSFVVAAAGSSTQIFSVVSPCLRYQTVASDHAITGLFLLGFLRSSVFQRFACPNAYLRRSAIRRLSFPPVHPQHNQR
jgi:hypothetical protein